MTNGVLLNGFGFAGFRSFGPEVQRVGPMGKVHLLAGPNNAGKSNVLTFAQRILPLFAASQPPNLNAVDYPRDGSGPIEMPVTVTIGVRVEDPAFVAELAANWVTPEQLKSLLDRTLGSPGDGLHWFTYVATRNPAGAFGGWELDAALRDLFTEVAESTRAGLANEMSGTWTGTRGGAPGEDAGRALTYIAQRLGVQALPPIAEIPAFRRIGSADQSVGEYGGVGLIDRLAQLQHPDDARAADRERFDEINQFVRELFGDATAALEIPHAKDTILVHHNGRRLPVENYGTGLHEVVILAAAATVLSGHLVCMEEPEIHLHPTLQRKLLGYLADHTDNQYLIATHSAHLLDMERASISSVRLTDGNTVISRVVEPADVAAISLDLGFRASDLVQSNAVLWVEGPSDRIYIRHWISLLAPELKEGIHYSLMFYGGALLKHLAATDPAVEQFVGLPRINRNFGVVIDSDRATQHARINATKKRVRDEVTALSNGCAWVTAGYTIENYVPCELLAAAVRTVYPNARSSWDGDKYVPPLGVDQIDGRTSPVDKGAIAQAVTLAWAADTEWPLDLKDRVRGLVDFVRSANGLATE